MKIVTLYLSTAIVFLVLDAVMLSTIIGPMFRANLQELMLATPRVGPAVGFYLLYIGCLLWLVSWPALGRGQAGRALIGGAVLGAAAYGTYEFTNLATLQAWSWTMTLTDWIWGMVLTGVSAWAGVRLTQVFHRPR